jgi:hypothetical protein
MDRKVGMKPLIVVLAALVATPALAQDAPVAVTYHFEKTFAPVPMNEAIVAAIATPGFAPQDTPGPATIVITAPDGWRYTSHRKKDHVQFRLVFSRGGDKIGEAEEVCTVAPPFDCQDQIASDIRSAAAVTQ